MGHRYYKAFYDAEKALIFLNSLYGVRFWVLLHEVVHHLLCLLPRTDFVYKLNQVFDWLDFVVSYKKYMSLEKWVEIS